MNDETEGMTQEERREYLRMKREENFRKNYMQPAREIVNHIQNIEEDLTQMVYDYMSENTNDNDNAV